MRAPGRRTASFLAAVALIVPATLGATAVTAAHSSPLCNSSTGCTSPDDPEASTGPTPVGPVTPDVPAKPTDPASPGPTDEPTETPTDPASPEPTDPGGLGLKDPDDEPTEKPNGKFPADAQRDDNAPVFTETPAAMGSESLSFKGLRGISFVAVPTKSGKKVVTLKIQADEISISGFSLTVKPPDEEYGLVTTADTMTLKGNVSVYIGSITATTKDGDSLTLGPDTPPPMDDVEPGLLRVTMGLVGSTADSINYSNTDQKLKKA